MTRHLVLFAREPKREALAKGLGASGEDLFAAFGSGWLDAARRAGASVILATPPEDRAAWRGRWHIGPEVSWMEQRGGSFGERLAGVARQAAAQFGFALIVGGDVPPSTELLLQAFEALEHGGQAVLAPAADGGVSLVALGASDVDLLACLAPRQRGVIAGLERRLQARGRRVVRIACAPDVDGRRSLRGLCRTHLCAALRSLARQVLFVATAGAAPRLSRPRRRSLVHPRGLRAPPALA